MMDKKIDWKDIIKSGLQVASYAIGMVITWLLFALTTILIVIDYVNDFQHLGVGIFIALLIEAITTWIVAVVFTVKLDNITEIERVKNGKTNRTKDFENVREKET